MTPKFNWFQRQLIKMASRALKVTGIPMRDPALAELFGIRDSRAGINVDETTAMGLSAYFCGIGLLSSAVAQLPLECCNVDSKGNVTVDDNHRVTTLFRNGVNPILPGYHALENGTQHAIQWGNAYYFIDRGQADPGTPIAALWPLMPDQVEPYIAESGEKKYKYTAKYPGEVSDVYEDYEMLQIPGHGYDGIAGSSVLTYARESLGLSLATESYGATFFGNNATPGGVITHPGDVNAEGQNQIRDDFEAKVKGPLKSRRVVVLDEGMKYTQIGIPPEDGQFLQTREFQVLEVARWLRIPPHMLYYMLAQTNNNVEVQGLDFLVYSLSPWLCRWTEAVKRKMLTKQEAQNKIVRFNLEPLLKMDTTTRFKKYQDGRNMGLYSLNDINRFEGRPLITTPDGDNRIVPSTMKVVGQADPTTPIAPDIIKSSIDVVSNLKPNTKTATAMLNAMMPGATEELITSIVATLKASGALNAKEDVHDTVSGGGDALQDAALNGAQITSLLLITDKVSTKQYPADAAIAMIQASFPTISKEAVTRIVNSLQNYTAPVPITEVKTDEKAKSLAL